MGRGYISEEIWARLVAVLEDTEIGMSGVDLSNKLGVNRSTMTKYLQIFAAKGLISQKNIGNVTLWSLESGQETYDFPADYFRARSIFLEFLLQYSESRVQTLIKNCLSSGASVQKLISEVFLPTVYSIGELFEEGKIGSSEQKLMQNIISNSLQLFNHIPTNPNSKKTIIVISADLTSNIISEAASASFRSRGWSVFHLGDMSSAISVLFDLDLQKLLGKISRPKSGFLAVVVFSDTEEGLKFFSDSVYSLKQKSRKPLKLILCGKSGKKTRVKSDFMSEKFNDIVQWSETASENLDP